MPRSYLELLNQVGANVTYDDAVANAHDVGTVEAQTNLEDFINIGVLTQFKDIKGTTNWFDNTTKTIEQLAAQPTTDELYHILYIEETGGLLSTGAAASSTNITAWWGTASVTGTLIDEAVTNSEGILASITKGDIAGEGGYNKVAIWDSNNDPIEDNQGNPVYAYLVVDDVGAPTAYTLYYYSLQGSTEVAYTFATDTSIKVFLSRQYMLKNLPRNALIQSNPMVSGLAEEANIGNSVFTEDNFVVDEATITANLDALDQELKDSFDALGITAGSDVMAYTSTNNIGATDTVNTAISTLDVAVGSRLFTEDNYITDGDSVTAALDKLDQSLKDVSDIVGSGSSLIVETTGVSRAANTEFSIPGNPDLTGKILMLYYNGQLQMAGAGNDYVISTAATGGITPLFNMTANKNLQYFITSAAV